MKKIYLIFLTAILSGLIISCDESFLEKAPVGKLPEAYLNSQAGVETLLVGAYSYLNNGGIGLWTNCPFNEVQGSIRGGEFMKGSEAFDYNQVSDAMSFNVIAGSAMGSGVFNYGYTGVDRCNTIVKKCADGVVLDWTTGRQTTVLAEARFLRGIMYMHLKKNFYNIPWLDENTIDYKQPNYVGDPSAKDYVDIWPNIFADFRFAMANLPATQTAQKPRANKWAAQCFYAEALIHAGTYDPTNYADSLQHAYDLLADAIANGKTSGNLSYGLLANYHDNFDAGYEHGAEYVFGIELSTLDGDADGAFASPNSMQSAQFTGMLWEGGWGFQQPSEWFANHFRTDSTGLPYLDMFGATGSNSWADRINDDYGTWVFTQDTQGLDPRLDWVVGRTGIEFMGYGPMQSGMIPYYWVRKQSDGGPYANKKFKTWADQKGVYESKNNCYPSMNLPLMRFADVLLLQAELEVRVNDDYDAARVLVNRVRQRMVDNSSSSRNWPKVGGKTGTVDCANYRISTYPGGNVYPFDNAANALKAILYERTLELGGEGKRFYDVVRFGLGDGPGGFEAADEFDTYLAFQKSLGRYGFWTSSYDFIPGRDEFMAIPTSAIDNSIVNSVPTLIQNPGY